MHVYLLIQDVEDTSRHAKAKKTKEKRRYTKRPAGTANTSGGGTIRSPQSSIVDLHSAGLDYWAKASDLSVGKMNALEMALEGSTAESSLQDSSISSEDSVKRSMIEDTVALSTAVVREKMRLKLALPSSNRGSLIFGNFEDELLNVDSMSDSGASQHTIPEVPSAHRTRNGSLADFYRLLTRNTSFLEETLPPGISPPTSIRDPLLSPHSNPSPNSQRAFGQLSSRFNASSAGSTLAAPMSSMPISPREALIMSAAASEGDPAAVLAKARTGALEWIIAAVAGDRAAILTLNQVLRNRDFSDLRRPYERLVRIFVEATQETMMALALDLINVLLSEIPAPHKVQFLDLWTNTNFMTNLNVLLRSEKIGHRVVVKTLQAHYIDNILYQANIAWDPRDPAMHMRMAVLSRVSEPILSFSMPIWENSTRLAFLACCYFAEHYPSQLRHILDENEAQTPDTYCLPLIGPHLILILNEFISNSSPMSTAPMPSTYSGGSQDSSATSSGELDYTDSQEDSEAEPPPSPTSTLAGNGILPIIFSHEDAYNELFAMALMIFDAVWSDHSGTVYKQEAILAKTRHLMSISIEASFDCASLMSQLHLNSQLSARSGLSPGSLAKLSASSVPSLSLQNTMSLLNNPTIQPWRSPMGPLAPLELRLFFSELVFWVSSTVTDVAQLHLLTDAVNGMRSLASHNGFPWDIATHHLLFHMLRNVVSSSDNSWLRQPMLSGQVALWVDFQLNSDPRGPSKLIEALEMIAIDHSEGYCLTKPLVRMLRSNRQMSIPLRIINRLFEYHDDDIDRHAYIVDLARSQALPIMKSKVWSTYAEVKHELFRFQRNLITSACSLKFDPSVREHEQLLTDCWQTTFPLIRLKHVGSVQWALLGFRKCVSLSSFRGMRLVGFQHLLHFVRSQHAMTQHLVLCGAPGTPALGDSAAALTNMLLRLLTSGENLMPMIFDREGFSEIHRLSFLCLIQIWLADQGYCLLPSMGSAPTPTSSAAASSAASNASSNNLSAVAANVEILVAKTEQCLISVLRNNKPSTADELAGLMNVSLDGITMGWSKLMERTNPNHYMQLHVPSLSVESLPTSPVGARNSGSATPAQSPAVPHAQSSRMLISQTSTANLFKRSPPPSLHGSSLSITHPDQMSVNKLKKMLGGGPETGDSQLMQSINASIASPSTSPHLSRTRSRQGYAAFAGGIGSLLDEPDYLAEYFAENDYEMRLREHELSNYITTHMQDANKRGRQRGSSRAEREAFESERITRTFASTKMSLNPEPIVPLADDEKLAKEIVKLRKAEAKEQKETKAALAKHKPFKA